MYCQGGVGEHVVSRTECLKLAQLGRSSVRVAHERLTCVVVVLPCMYVCWIVEVQVGMICTWAGLCGDRSVGRRKGGIWKIRCVGQKQGLIIAVLVR